MPTLIAPRRTFAARLISPWRPLELRDSLTVVRRLFVLWLVLRTAGWTLLAWSQPNPPLDTIEWVAWGQTWQLGYHKHPPLAAWIADLAFRLTGGSFLGVYLAGYLAIALALWCVWRLAQQMLPPRAALASVLCLDGLIYLGSFASEFNNQILLIAFWTWTIERFHAAVLSDRWRDWCLTGLALGLALLCKYTAVLLALPLLAWWVWQNGLQRWNRPLVVALVASLVFLPHLAWLVQHDFPTLRYAAQRAEGTPGSLPPRLSGFVFLLSQSLRLLPVGLILLPMLVFALRPLDAMGRRDRSFLLAAVAGPVLLHLAASLVGGVKLRDIWGVPLWTATGLLLLVVLKTEEVGRAWFRLRLTWGAVVLVTVVTVLVSNRVGSAWLSRPMRIHYPGARLAEEVTTQYRQRHGLPPAIVAGDWWLAGNISCHSAHRPTVYGSQEPAYVGLNLKRDRGDPRRFASPAPQTTPWTDDEDLQMRGGILVWDASVYGEDLPRWLHARFPSAQCQRSMHLETAGGGKELVVGWAMLAPGVEP